MYGSGLRERDIRFAALLLPEPPSWSTPYL